MKNLLFIVFIGLLAACSNAEETKEKKDVTSSDLGIDRIEVYAFHGTRQCTTCKNMKALTKSTLETYFAKEMKEGTITYHIVDVDDDMNYELAEKFEATGTALMINRIKDGKENIEDWSDFAFEYANGEKATYEKELKRLIDKQLK
jgi:glutaredoxin